MYKIILFYVRAIHFELLLHPNIENRRVQMEKSEKIDK